MEDSHFLVIIMDTRTRHTLATLSLLLGLGLAYAVVDTYLDRRREAAWARQAQEEQEQQYLYSIDDYVPRKGSGPNSNVDGRSEFVEKNIDPLVANAYDSRFTVPDVTLLLTWGREPVPPSYANAISEEIPTVHIWHFYSAGIHDPDKVNDFAEIFSRAINSFEYEEKR